MPSRCAPRTGEPLHRICKRSLDHVQRSHVTSAGEFQKRPWSRQSKIPATHGVMSLAFQMIRKRQDVIRLNVIEFQARRRPLQTLTGEVEEQHERIAIAGHRMRTDRALCDQTLGEELLNQRGKRWRLGAMALRIGHLPLNSSRKSLLPYNAA